MRAKINLFENLFRELINGADKKYSLLLCLLVENDLDIKNHPIQDTSRGQQNLEVFVFFETSAEKLPLHCNQIVTLTSGHEGNICLSENGNKVQEFEYQAISDMQAGAVVQMLAPVLL